ncbi:MAG TPA: ATP-binding cassette domain-containing protein [Acidobacteria bacterium]|nr:ATP-binding cassette domain-containing protein [Acidobacteriota bacterium]
MGALLEVRGLVKRYGERAAVDDLSFTVGEGEIYGLLGPNGAGKTTTIKVLTGLLPPTSGSVRVAGFDPYAEPLEAKAQLGWVGQETSLYEDLTARENLELACALGRVPRAEVRRRVAGLLETIGLADRAKERVSRYSGGMKRRLHLAVALVHRPKVLLLDEPLVGVDPQARAHLMGLIGRLAEEGHAVLLTTHDMDDAERLSSRVGILDHGRLLAEGTVEELQARLGERDVLRLTGAFPEEIPPLPAKLGAELLSRRGDELMLAVPNGSQALPVILAFLERHGLGVDRVTLERPTLETLFLELTGRELRD